MAIDGRGSMTLEKWLEGLFEVLHSFCEREQLSEHLVFVF